MRLAGLLPVALAAAEAREPETVLQTIVCGLASNLGLALDALAEDKVVRSAMPGDMYRLYELYKRDEWDAFNATVSNWDIDRYLDCLP